MNCGTCKYAQSYVITPWLTCQNISDGESGMTYLEGYEVEGLSVLADFGCVLWEEKE